MEFSQFAPGIDKCSRSFRLYDEPEKSAQRGHYTEFRASDDPSSYGLLFGDPGDIFIDEVNSKIYLRTAKKWVRWKELAQKLVHPNHSHRFLWIARGRVEYFKESEVKRNKITDFADRVKLVAGARNIGRPLKRKSETSIDAPKAKRGRLSNIERPPTDLDETPSQSSQSISAPFLPPKTFTGSIFSGPRPQTPLHHNNAVLADSFSPSAAEFHSLQQQLLQKQKDYDELCQKISNSDPQELPATPSQPPHIETVASPAEVQQGLDDSQLQSPPPTPSRSNVSPMFDDFETRGEQLEDFSSPPRHDEKLHEETERKPVVTDSPAPPAHTPQLDTPMEQDTNLQEAEERKPVIPAGPPVPSFSRTQSNALPSTKNKIIDLTGDDSDEDVPPTANPRVSVPSRRRVPGSPSYAPPQVQATTTSAKAAPKPHPDARPMKVEKSDTGVVSGPRHPAEAQAKKSSAAASSIRSAPQAQLKKKDVAVESSGTSSVPAKNGPSTSITTNSRPASAQAQLKKNDSVHPPPSRVPPENATPTSTATTSSRSSSSQAQQKKNDSVRPPASRVPTKNTPSIPSTINSRPSAQAQLKNDSVPTKNTPATPTATSSHPSSSHARQKRNDSLRPPASHASAKRNDDAVTPRKNDAVSAAGGSSSAASGKKKDAAAPASTPHPCAPKVPPQKKSAVTPTASAPRPTVSSSSIRDQALSAKDDTLKVKAVTPKVEPSTPKVPSLAVTQNNDDDDDDDIMIIDEEQFEAERKTPKGKGKEKDSGVSASAHSSFSSASTATPTSDPSSSQVKIKTEESVPARIRSQPRELTSTSISSPVSASMNVDVGAPNSNRVKPEPKDAEPLIQEALVKASSSSASVSMAVTGTASAGAEAELDDDAEMELEYPDLPGLEAIEETAVQQSSSTASGSASVNVDEPVFDDVDVVMVKGFFMNSMEQSGKRCMLCLLTSDTAAAFDPGQIRAMIAHLYSSHKQRVVAERPIIEALGIEEATSRAEQRHAQMAAEAG